MFKIHTADGKTTKVDLADEEQAREWINKLARPDFQERITAVSAVERHEIRGRCSTCNGKVSAATHVQYSVPRPDAASIYFHLEAVEPDGTLHGGSRVTLFSDEVRLVLMAHRSQPSSRVTLAKLGKQKFNPYLRSAS